MEAGEDRGEAVFTKVPIPDSMYQDVDNPVLARCRVREYLQARLLQALQDHHAFGTWAFVGGTALRFLFGLPRFSEDLDFSLIESGAEDRFRALLMAAKNTFVKEGYRVTVKLKDDKTVKSAFLRFSGLLYELGLSPLAAESLAIKVGTDTNPPAGAQVAKESAFTGCDSAATIQAAVKHSRA